VGRNPCIADLLPPKGLAGPKLHINEHISVGPFSPILLEEVFNDPVPLLLSKWVGLGRHRLRPPFFGKPIEGILFDHFLGHSITEEGPSVAFITFLAVFTARCFFWVMSASSSRISVML